MDKEDNLPDGENNKKISIWNIMTKKRIKGLTDTNIRIKEMLDANTRKQIEFYAKKINENSEDQ